MNMLLSVQSQRAIAAAYAPKPPPSIEAKPKVPDEVKRILLRMHRQGHPLGKIAEAVGLSGCNYELFKAVCAELGIRKAEEA